MFNAFIALFLATPLSVELEGFESIVFTGFSVIPVVIVVFTYVHFGQEVFSCFFQTAGTALISKRSHEPSINFSMTLHAFVRISESIAAIKFLCEPSMYSTVALSLIALVDLHLANLSSIFITLLFLVSI